MGRSWNEVRAEKERLDQEAGRDVESVRQAARERTNAYVLGDRLAQLRNEIGMTQRDIAERMGVSQPRISKLEQGDLDQMEIDTVRRYVSALGGELRIVADFTDHDVTVSTSEIDHHLAGASP